MPIRTLTQEDLRWLVCPVCHQALVLALHSEGMPAIRCTDCGRVYPIMDGLPVLLAERATQEKMP